MTNKVYKSAMGKPVDLGALLLQNEGVRAVGNMGVNARGDIVDSKNRVIEKKNRQVTKHYKKQSNVASEQVFTSSLAARRAREQAQQPDVTITDLPAEEFTDIEIEAQADAVDTSSEPAAIRGGLAGAIARSRMIKQEQEKTLRERQQEQGIKKI